MKKTVAVLLALLMLFSITAMPAFAALPDFEAFQLYLESPNGKQLYYSPLPEGSDITLIAKNYEPDSYVEDGVRYYFVGWKDVETGVVRTSDKLPKLTKTVTYIAQFEAEEPNEGQSLLAFFASIFERINRILEYFWNIFFAERA